MVAPAAGRFHGLLVALVGSVPSGFIGRGDHWALALPWVLNSGLTSLRLWLISSLSKESVMKRSMAFLRETWAGVYVVHRLRCTQVP